MDESSRKVRVDAMPSDPQRRRMRLEMIRGRSVSSDPGMSARVNTRARQRAARNEGHHHARELTGAEIIESE